MANDQKIDLTGDGGVLKEILTEGTGDGTPGKGFTVVVHYTGTLLDGTKFDSSRDRNQPFEFELGKQSVIRGFEIGIPTMKKGEKCVLTIRGDYAYGSAGSPPTIPPDATLAFELEMLGWKGEDISPDKTGEIERFIVTAGEKMGTPDEGDNVEIHLVGTCEGREFDNRELQFDLIEAEEFDVIKGVQIGIGKMHRGETSRFAIKPAYAYKGGDEKRGIPANATVEFTVTLKNFTAVTRVWKMDDQDKIDRAQVMKEKAVAYIKRERYQMALNLFKYANQFLDKESELDKMKELMLAMHLNTALCHQKLGNHMEAKNACTEAMVFDPYNVKAYYRRGQCWTHLWELEEAEADFKKVIELDPKNTAAQQQIAYLAKKKQDAKNAEKKLFANMFTKMALANEKV